eukprot:5181716-Pleurochrysis_carterae.AAC.3
MGHNLGTSEKFRAVAKAGAGEGTQKGGGTPKEASRVREKGQSTENWPEKPGKEKGRSTGRIALRGGG